MSPSGTLSNERPCLFPTESSTLRIEAEQELVALGGANESTRESTSSVVNGKNGGPIGDIKTRNETKHLLNSSSSKSLTNKYNFLTPKFHSWEAENLEQVKVQWNLNEKQFTALQSFQQQIETIEHYKNSPHTACQFLKENRWNVPKSVKQFERMIEWRQHHQVDSILDPESSNYYKPHADFNLFPQAILQGTDREGNPIYVERTGVTHIWDLWDRHGEEEMLRASLWVREVCTRGEWVKEWERQQERGLQGTTAVVDLVGLSKKHVSRSVLHLVKDGTKIVQENWPCEAKRVIIIRAPFIFRFVWNFLKPFLTETVKEMVVICTASDPLPELEQYMDLTVLPKCINPETGEGDAIPEFGPIQWEGGPVRPQESKPIIETQGTMECTDHSVMTSSEILTSPVSSSSSKSGEDVKTISSESLPRTVSSSKSGEDVTRTVLSSMSGNNIKPILAETASSSPYKSGNGIKKKTSESLSRPASSKFGKGIKTTTSTESSTRSKSGKSSRTTSSESSTRPLSSSKSGIGIKMRSLGRGRF